MPESLVATVVIAGFGAAGASVALALVSGGMAPQDILVVDPEIDREASASPDMRILAFNAGSRHYLSALGIWPELTATAWPMRRIRRWNSVSGMACSGSMRRRMARRSRISCRSGWCRRTCARRAARRGFRCGRAG
jgi:2-polyprenyl-6-methoxyphenol hydroxylase-like FAD-dependent oxidoreductase